MIANERRQLSRFSLDVPARIFMGAEENKRPVTPLVPTHTRDISARGAFLYLERSPGPGTKLRVEIRLIIDFLPELLHVPDEVRVTVHGTVVRRNHFGIGVAFDEALHFDQPVTVDEPTLDEEVERDE